MNIESEKARLLALADAVGEHDERYLPTYGSSKCASTEDLNWSVGAARGDGWQPADGHDMCDINRNSLDRIITYFVRKATHDFAALVRAMDGHLAAQDSEIDALAERNEKLRARIAELEDQLHAARSKYE